MLQVARLAPQLLRESTELVAAFVLDQLAPNGGFRDRDGAADLYYTLFGTECLLALRTEFPPDTREYLCSFTDPETIASLDLVHLSSAVRATASRGLEVSTAARAAFEAEIDRHRTPDGGYATERGADMGNVYGVFLAVGALQDLGSEIPSSRIAEFLSARRQSDGGYANDARVAEGATPATAAAVTVARTLGIDCPASAGEWLVRSCRRAGGFCAGPRTPVPDLLSTATALHALAALECPLDSIRDDCLEFIDTLWTSRGSFYGHWAEDTLDCEYTYYGLLALGHLSL